MKCNFTGCKQPAKWECKQLWGKGGALLTCDEHKPDPAKRPESLKHLPFFYDVKPLWKCPSCESLSCEGYCTVDRWDGQESDRGIR